MQRFGAFPPTFENLMKRASQLNIQIIEGQGFPAELINEPFILAPYHDGGLFKIIPMDIFIYLNLMKTYSGKTPTAVAMTDLNLDLPRSITEPLVRRAYSSIQGVNLILIEAKSEDKVRQYIEMVVQAKFHLENISVLIIFPSGKLSYEFDPNETYPEGTAFLARRCKVPIVPACTIGIETWTQQSTIYVAFGQPIPPGTNRRDDPAITEILHQHINSLNDLLKSHLSSGAS